MIEDVEDFVTAVPGTAPGTVFQTLGYANVSGGKVAFAGEWSGRTKVGIFLRSNTGPSATATLQTIIKTGDILFGSTVTSVFTEGSHFYANDTIAFNYTLANGVSGVATASLLSAAAPEPGTLAFLALGGTLILVRRRQGL